jgi:hypothetical protein
MRRDGRGAGEEQPMNVKGAAIVDTFGKTVDVEFGDMDANGEHGLALALIATALTEVREIGPEHATVVDAVVIRVQTLVHQYIQRETPVQYV